jgi:hypothetical protein
VLIGAPAQQLLDLFAAADADTALQLIGIHATTSTVRPGSGHLPWPDYRCADCRAALNIACAAAAEIARICTSVRDSCCYTQAEAARK